MRSPRRSVLLRSVLLLGTNLLLAPALLAAPEPFKIATVVPAPGSPSVSIGSRVALVFSHPINPKEINLVGLVDQDGTPVVVERALALADRAVVLTPRADLKPRVKRPTSPFREMGSSSSTTMVPETSIPGPETFRWMPPATS